jgi:hypothetical protein
LQEKFVPSENETFSDEFVKTGGHDVDLQTYQQHWKASATVRLEKIKNMKSDEKLTS